MTAEERSTGNRGARVRVLAAAATLFPTRGIMATSMEDVAAQAPVSKRTLYAHFPRKQDLVVAYLRQLADDGPTVREVLMREDLSIEQRLLSLFDVNTGLRPVRGCPFIDAAVEYPDPDDPVHTLVREEKTAMLDLVADLVRRLGAPHPVGLAEQLVTLADGAASRAMVFDDPDYGRHARDAARTLLDSALPHGAV